MSIFSRARSLTLTSILSAMVLVGGADAIAAETTYLAPYEAQTTTHKSCGDPLFGSFPVNASCQSTSSVEASSGRFIQHAQITSRTGGGVGRATTEGTWATNIASSSESLSVRGTIHVSEASFAQGSRNSGEIWITLSLISPTGAHYNTGNDSTVVIFEDVSDKEYLLSASFDERSRMPEGQWKVAVNVVSHAALGPGFPVTAGQGSSSVSFEATVQSLRVETT